MNILEINQKKVLKTKALLAEVIKEPLPFEADTILSSALKSQTGLAQYINEDRNITSCSLNTLKNASESLLARGFVELDELRINAKDALESAVLGKKATTRTRTGLKHKVDDLQTRLNTLKKRNFLQSVIIEDFRYKLKELAYSNPSPEQVQTMYHELNKRIEAKLSYTLNGEL